MPEGMTHNAHKVFLWNASCRRDLWVQVVSPSLVGSSLMNPRFVGSSFVGRGFSRDIQGLAKLGL
jgi:hypothetical protein